MGFSRSPGPSPTPNFPEFPPASSPFPPLVRPPRPPLAWSAEPGKCSVGLRAQEPPPGAPGMGAQVAGVVPSTLPQPTRSRPPRSSLRWGSPPGSSIRPQCAGCRSPPLGHWPPLHPTNTTSSSSPRHSSASGPGAAPTPSPGPSGRAWPRQRHSPGSRSRGLARSRRW